VMLFLLLDAGVWLVVRSRCLRSVGIMMDGAAAGTSSKFRKS
jgi:hypothetical protein